MGEALPAQISSPRFRKERSGPEIEMVHAALAAGLPFKWLNQAVTFQEPELPSGAPDLILLRINQFEGSGPAPLSEHELKLLHFISSKRAVSLPVVCVLLCWTTRLAEKVAASLGGQLLLVEKGGQLTLTQKARQLLAREIVAIEAKVGEWRRALVQAQRNQWFASESYLLLQGNVSSAAIAAASDAGVGILSFDGQRAKVLVRSEKSKLPGSYASWLVSMWAHQEVRT